MGAERDAVAKKVVNVLNKVVNVAKKVVNVLNKVVNISKLQVVVEIVILQ